MVQHRSITAAFSTDSRVYLQDGPFVEGYDIGTGKLLGTVHLPNSAVQLSYRDDGVFVALDSYANRLYKFDATTFQQLSAASTPNQGDWTLSRDGNVLIAGGATGPLEYSTRTGQPIPTKSVNAMPFALYFSDARWWLQYSGVTRNDTVRAVSAADGVSFDAAPQHPAVANCTTFFPWPAVMSEYLPTGEERVLLSYTDGVLEVRNTGGTLLNTVTLGTCGHLSLKTFPGKTGKIAFTSNSGTGFYDVAGNQIIKSNTFQDLGLMLLNGSLSSAITSTPPGSGSSYANQATYTFTPQNGAAWKLNNASRTLTLNVSSKFIDKTQIALSGTAIVDGQNLNVSGKLTTEDVEIQAQGLFYFNPTFHVALDFFDGTTQLYSATLSNHLTTYAAPGDSKTPLLDTTVPPSYEVSLSEADTNPLSGVLTRP
ncbi:hypothetical protein MF271_07365 [Deinococcus sp. KNUC1210]|uniref:YncE family protein n=1 Tax=Deinococcus sp. KNUC1210 TaxID=2917691 RepID=UPI001EF107A7|nr:hypothetical protein [Deinococcus sp. KNUC1210]ULH16399.1 hypothetical protein MF271_07365 [Deinococcus sp. KNUC1210]